MPSAPIPVLSLFLPVPSPRPQQLNWEQATARVSVFASLGDGSSLPVSRNSVTAAVQPLTSANSTTTSGIPFRLQALTGFASVSLIVNGSFGAPALCGPYLQSRWSACSGTLPMATGKRSGCQLHHQPPPWHAAFARAGHVTHTHTHTHTHMRLCTHIYSMTPPS